MKKIWKISLIAVAAIVVVLLVVYRAVNTVPDEDTVVGQVSEILDDGGCISCHSASPVLPFYASWPVVGSLVQKDSQDGYRAFDIVPMLNALDAAEDALDGENIAGRSTEIHPVDLAKVEKVILDGRMPMAKYYLVHWGSSVTNAKKRIVLDWAATVRASHNTAYDGVAEEFANEPVRPVGTFDTDPAKVALGYELFHDTRLSSDNTVSCSTCHGLNTGGVDNKQYSEGVDGQLGGVNAPTVYNAVYNFVQFWDGRAATLAHQAAGPPLNPVEMACESFDEIVAKLNADKDFAARFRAVYPEGISEATITDAIQEFEMTLTTVNSRFDKYLRGDKEALTAQEINGYELFKKYDCATCHNGPILGGRSYELIGVRNDYFADRGSDLTVEDNGRYKETKNEYDRHRFKTPGLRNVELTWPYYHDGSRLTLSDAIKDMAYYQGNHKFSDAQLADIEAFLKTLTGEYQGRMLTNENKK